MALDPNGHQGLYGESYIYMLASAAGLTTSKMNLDYDGVDWQLAFPGPRGTKRSPKLEIQVKSTSSPEEQGEYYQYRLSVRRFNKIAGPGFDIPRYFGLVVVPKDAKDYAVCSNDNMTLSHAAYWTSLATEELRPDGDGAPQSVGLLVPKKNLLTVDSLLELIEGNLEGAAT